MVGVLQEAGTAHTSRPTGFTFGFRCVRDAHLFRFCVEWCFCVLFVFVLCLVCPMLPVSLCCPFLVALLDSLMII